MTISALIRGGRVTERRCHPRSIEEAPALRVGNVDVPEDIEIVVAGGRRQRYFTCPGCGSIRRVLFDPDETGIWRCRACHRLDHAVRHEGSDPLVRAAELRRKLGGSGSWLDPLPPRPAGGAGLKYDLLMVELLALEARALEKLRRMSAGITKYARRFR